MTVHLDKVLLLMTRGSPCDRPLTGGSIREGRGGGRGGGNGRTLSIIRANDEGKRSHAGTWTHINILTHPDMNTQHSQRLSEAA